MGPSTTSVVVNLYDTLAGKLWVSQYDQVFPPSVCGRINEVQFGHSIFKLLEMHKGDEHISSTPSDLVPAITLEIEG